MSDAATPAAPRSLAEAAWVRALNAVAFQAGWFACVLGASRGWPLLGPTVVALWAGAYLLLASDRPRREAVLVLLAVPLGLLVDSLHLRAGVLTFAANPEAAWAPAWMIALWPNLAATLRSSLGWLRGRLHAAAVLGAAAGPVAYLAGARLGAVRLADSLPYALGVVAVSWAACLPLLVRGAEWVDAGAPRGDEAAAHRRSEGSGRAPAASERQVDP